MPIAEQTDQEAIQHLMLAAPNACLGHQQTAQMMADDILAQRIPIMDGPRWI